MTNIETLQEVAKKLEDNDIKFGVCLTHKTNTNFRIVIEDTTDFIIIRNFFEPSTYEERGKFLRFKYKDILITFIKVNIEDFNIAIYYYSWETLMLIMKHMLMKMGMRLTDTGLYYNYFGTKIYLTNNIKNILNFLDLNDRIFRDGFQTPKQQLDYIMLSYYFNPSILNEITVDIKDFFYKEKTSILKQIKEDYDDSSLSFEFHEYSNDLESYWEVIDFYFKNLFLPNILKLKYKYE